MKDYTYKTELFNALVPMGIVYRGNSKHDAINKAENALKVAVFTCTHAVVTGKDGTRKTVYKGVER